jgi:hypothetical protein
MGSLGSPERRPANVMVILDKDNAASLPNFRTYTKDLPMLIQIKNTEGQLSVQSEMDVFQKLLPLNEDVLKPTQGVVVRSIQLCGYYNPAPFGFSADLKFDLKSFSDSSVAGLYGFNQTKSCSRNPIAEKKGKKKKNPTKEDETDEIESIDSMEKESIVFKIRFQADTLAEFSKNTEDATEFVWKHSQYKTMVRFANFNFSALNASSIRGTSCGNSKTLIVPTVKEEEEKEERSDGSAVVHSTTSTTAMTTTTTASVSTSKNGSTTSKTNETEDNTEELHWSDSLIHGLILSMIISELKSTHEDNRSERLTHYSSLLKYGQDNEFIDAASELQTQLDRRQQQQQQQQQTSQQQTLQQQTLQQSSKKWVFINGTLCKEVRNHVRKMSESIRYTNLCDEGMTCTVYLARNTNIEEKDSYSVIFTLRMEYMYVPFDNVRDSK